MQNRELLRDRIRVLHGLKRLNPYPIDVFPATLDEVESLLTTRGLSDAERTAVAGRLARLGYEKALQITSDLMGVNGSVRKS